MAQTPDLFRPATAVSRLTPSEEHSLKSSLMSWTMVENLPANVPQILPSAIADARDSLRPADPKAVAVLMDRLFLTLPKPVSRDSAGNVQADVKALQVWRNEMSRYPADLLADAVDEVIRTHKWETVPKLAQVVEQVRPEIIKRRAWLNKLTSADLKLRMTHRHARKPSTPSLTPADRGPMPDRVAQLLAETKAKLMGGEDELVPAYDRMGGATKERVRAERAEREAEVEIDERERA